MEALLTQSAELATAVDETYTRRQLVVGAVSLAAAAHGFGQRERFSDRFEVIRAISTPYFSPDVYGTDDTKELVINGGAEVVVLWAPPMSRLMPEKGGIDQTEMERYKRDLAAAHAIRKHINNIFVVCPSEYPTSVAAMGHAPSDLAIDSEFASYIRIVLEPALDVAAAFGPYNETNIAFAAESDPAETTAEMTILTDSILFEMGYSGRVLYPSAADTISNDLGVGFITRTYQSLVDKGFKPQSRFNWGAIHNYRGLELNSFAAIKANYALLNSGRLQADNNKVLITEGGERFFTVKIGPHVYYEGPLKKREIDQLFHYRSLFNWIRRTGLVEMVTQYTDRDFPDNFESGLRRMDGTHRPVYGPWKRGFRA